MVTEGGGGSVNQSGSVLSKRVLYCGIIIVQGGTLIVEFMSHPYSQVYILNKCKSYIYHTMMH